MATARSHQARPLIALDDTQAATMVVGTDAGPGGVAAAESVFGATMVIGGTNPANSAAAADILLWRQQVIADLHHRGVLVVDAFPENLAAPLVNEYLRVKAKHLL